jgi:hypothetical protein
MNRKIIISSAVAAALMAGTALPVIAQTGTGTSGSTGGATTTTTTTTSSAATKIACVGAAVNAREQAISSAEQTFSTASSAAYSARASALQQAYTATTYKDVRAAVKAAWTAFSSAERAAHKDWVKARDGAWKTYRTAAVACKAQAGTGDGVHSDAEVSGN